MTGNRIARILGILALWGVAASARFGMPAPETARFAAAAALVLFLPGWWIASSIRPGEGRRLRIPLAWAAAQGVLALFAVLFQLLRLPLAALFLPLGALGFVAAFRGGGGGSRRDTVETILIGAAALLLVLVAQPRTGPISDAYDHLGGVRHMIERGDPFPHESFHADRIENLDPRKGTNHTAWALIGLLAGADPLFTYPAFWVLHVWLILLVLLRLAEALLPGRGEATAGAVFFALLYRGGPADEWFWTAGYPGKAGLLLFFLAVELALRSGGGEERRGERRLRAAALLLGAGAAGVHAFSGFLSIAGATLVAASFLALPRLRGSAGGPIRFLAALIAGAAPIFLFRFLFTYDPANPLHLHRQGTLILSDRMAMLEPSELWKTVTAAGAISLLLLPLFFGRGRVLTPGELFLVLSPLLVLFLVMNPILYPLLEERGGYLTRRLPLLAPYPLVLGAVAWRGCKERRSPARALGGLAALLTVLFTFQSGFAGNHSRGERNGETTPGGAALRDAAALIPASATVLTDPLTGYTLYARTTLHPTAIPDQHSSPNDPDGARRLTESQRILRGLAGPAETDRFLDRYGVRYVLLNEGYDHSFHTYNVFVSPEAFRRGAARLDARPERFLPLETPPGFRLYRVLDGAMVEAEDARREDPPAPGPRIDVPLPGGFRLLAGRLDRKSAAPGEIVTLTTSWLLDAEEADVRPPLLFLRGRREGDPSYETLRLRRDDRLRPWAIVPLGGLEDPALLWKGGDRVREIRRVRVPRSIPPGDYRLEVTVEPDPFFPVRKLDGLRRGAARETWIAVDTLEVRP
ncbi:MAG: hypothetical protein JW958_06790 [Candidatus Eisenbacteria bacterium]|nr:hypothetical protein [Candidatus Eisenbacteria bacterium]